MGCAVRTLVATALGAAVALASGPARADSLTPDETTRLLHGDTVSRTQDLHRGHGKYVGGVSYKILDASEGDLVGLLDDVASWRRFLPKTRDARLVGTAGADPLVRITHGSAIVQVAYTLRVHRDGDVVRFWMDRSRTHDIEDVWGFFRAEPMPDGRILVTYGILIDMGDGILRDLFESRVREVALEVPDHVRDAVAERQARGRHAAR
ncbi:MAG TPA: hypothetical protein VIF09_16605 [Polyangiaceae bacterium]|jgi:hypothetical protein